MGGFLSRQGHAIYQYQDGTDASHFLAVDPTNPKYAGGAKGDGASDDYAAIQTAIDDVASAGGGVVQFPTGVFKCSATPTISSNYVHLRGRFAGDASTGTVLYYAGSGNCLAFDGGAVSGTIRGVGVRDMVIAGNAASQHGLFLRGGGDATIDNLKVMNTTGDGIHAEWFEEAIVKRYVCTVNDSPMSPIPAKGIYLGQRGTTESTNWTIIHPRIEGLSGIGIHLDYAAYNTIIGGTVQGMTGTGVGLKFDAHKGNHNTIQGSHFELNGGGDIVCNGFLNYIERVTATTATATSLDMTSTDYGNTVVGGYFDTIKDESSGSGLNWFDGVSYATSFTRTAARHASLARNMTTGQWDPLYLNNGLWLTAFGSAPSSTVGGRIHPPCAGSPNSNVTGYVGDMIISLGGGAGTTLYIKESGAGTNTGWVGK